MKAIIVEDELPSARRLARLLQGFEIEILAQLNSIKATLNWFQKNKQPDVIFLDIQLSDGDCFEIFKHIEITSKIIFTTAFSNYSIKAFDYNSISYLLKPINKDKLSEAIHKAKNAHQKEEDLEKFKKMILNHQTEIYKESFTIKVGNKIKIIKVDEVVCFYSFDNATYIKTDTNNYIISDSLTSLEVDLNPKVFFRVNRTFIIKKTTVKEMINHSNSRLKLILNVDIETEIIVSRERVKNFKLFLYSV